MAKNMHTPEPWRAVQNLSASENHRGWLIVAEGSPIGEVYPLTEDGSIAARGNASLIPAAPDLYAACKAAVDFMEVIGNPAPPHPHMMLLAAIAKAEGK